MTCIPEPNWNCVLFLADLDSLKFCERHFDGKHVTFIWFFKNKKHVTQINDIHFISLYKQFKTTLQDVHPYEKLGENLWSSFTFSALLLLMTWTLRKGFCWSCLFKSKDVHLKPTIPDTVICSCNSKSHSVMQLLHSITWTHFL